MDPRASELIRLLELNPHPEGGYFSEIFRSSHTVAPAGGENADEDLRTLLLPPPSNRIGMCLRLRNS